MQNDYTSWQENIRHRLGNYLKKNRDSLLKLQGGLWVQYGVKICLITSFKDTCFIEIAPTEQKSERGLIFICLFSSFGFIKNNTMWNGIHLVMPVTPCYTYLCQFFWSVITSDGMVWSIDTLHSPIYQSNIGNSSVQEWFNSNTCSLSFFLSNCPFSIKTDERFDISASFLVSSY